MKELLAKVIFFKNTVITNSNYWFKFKNQLCYVKKFIKSPLIVESLVQSSSRLCDNRIDGCKTFLKINELGAADGILTRSTLSKMKNFRALISFEIQKNFSQERYKIKYANFKIAPHSDEYLNSQYNTIFHGFLLLLKLIKSRMKPIKEIQFFLHDSKDFTIPYRYTRNI